MIKFLKQKLGLIIPLSIFCIGMIVISIIPTNYEVTTPGNISNVDSIIEIENEYEQKGSFNTTSVYVYDKCSVLKYLLSLLNESAIIEKRSDVVDYSSDINQMSGKIQKENSITNSLIAAYAKAGIKIDYTYQGIIIHTLYNNASSDLHVGDVISKIGDYNFNSKDEFLELYNKLRVDPKYFDGDICKLPVTINGESKVIESSDIKEQNGLKYPVFGFAFYDHYKIDEESCSPKYNINKQNTEGPSGGLMQSLSIYNALTSFDYTHGLKIAGTGTISADGLVGAIGGMYSKVYTAYYMDVDIFFVPYYIDEFGESNFEEALRAYKDLGSPVDFKIVKVSTLDDAINYLQNLGGNNA